MVWTRRGKRRLDRPREGGYAGYVHVFAMATADSTRHVMGEAVVRVLPLPASRIEVHPAPSTLLAGARLTLSGTPYSAQGDRRTDPVSFCFERAPRSQRHHRWQIGCSGTGRGDHHREERSRCLEAQAARRSQHGGAADAGADPEDGQDGGCGSFQAAGPGRQG